MSFPSTYPARTNSDATYRANAILFHGPPIAHLPTARLFAYATHFDSRPMGLEWIDDNTCVFVFETKAAARSAQRRLQKSATEEMDVDGFVTAKPIPVALWPPEERINKSLGKGEGLKGTIRMRWARTEDVKKRGAKKSSEFYKKHGASAGKEGYVEGEERPQKRRRASSIDQVLRKAQLDEDLDRFLADEDDLDAASPPLRSADSPPPELASRMRSDYIADDGRTLLDPPSGLSLADRIMAPLPRRTAAGSSNGGSGNGRWRRGQVDEGFSGLGRHSEGDRPRSSRNRPRKSQRELDDELEAFLNERS
jgi:hypothetical protein